jgi:HAMP domain-containing protein
VTDKLPDNGGYVAAAYLVFLALLLIYLAIAALRASRLERRLQELNDLAARDEQAPAAVAMPEPAATGSEP